ncbi:MAG: DUF4154 domain-containing protein [Bacteroidales bacterium]|nr:DUF4154 domain-containing protein [Bacteroidales bacterium]
MRNKIKYLFIIILLIITCYSSAQNTSDANLKTAYIYNFATYIKWENENNIDTFKIGVFGNDTVLFQALRNMVEIRLLKNKPIKIINFSDVEDLNRTQILYVLKKRNSEINKISEKIKRTNTLLITNDYDFNKSMINFVYVNGTWQFELNEKNVKNENLVILPKLIAIKKSKSELKKLYFKTDELLESEKEKVKTQRSKIAGQKEEIVKQSETIKNQKENIILQQKNINFQKEKLNNLVEENIKQQKKIDLKIKLLDIKEKERIEQEAIIKVQQTEINKQKNNVEDQNFVLEKQKNEITSRQNEIESLNANLNKQLEKIKMQRLILFLFIALIILILGLVFYIYKAYRIKKESNRKLVEKNFEITQQKEEIQTQAEHLEIVNKELEKLSIVARETDNAVIIMDSKGNFEWVNQGFTRMYELSLNEFINDFGGNIMNANLNTNNQEMIYHCLEKKEPVIFESFFITKSNKEIWVQTTLTPILVDNKIEKLVAIDSDISKIKEFEEKILQQKDEIEAQRDDIETKRDLAIKQRDEISRQKQDITDSIQYAKRIQTAVFPSDDFINNILNEYFILNKPKGIVGGDFYWISENNGQTIIAIGDCTGHGVPGGFMSMLGITFLNKIVNEKGITKPSEILNHLRINIIESLHQTGEFGEVDDGMDISLISVNKKNHVLQYAGAMNSLYIISTDIEGYKLKEIKADRISICISRLADKSFTNHKIGIKKGDTVYLSTDGYLDQFGGSKGERFKAENFRQLILKLQELTMSEQKKALNENIESWRGLNNQIDDILVMGIRIE